MANIFKQNLDVNQHPNRANHDLTHKIHGSYKFGYLYPFMTEYVAPTDSFEIDTACGFQLMPMPFPTQTNMRAEFYFFYQRINNVWPNFENWIMQLEEHTPPFLNQPSSFYKTGELPDFLDIVTTFCSRANESMNVQLAGVMLEKVSEPNVGFPFRGDSYTFEEMEEALPTDPYTFHKDYFYMFPPSNPSFPFAHNGCVDESGNVITKIGAHFRPYFTLYFGDNVSGNFVPYLMFFGGDKDVDFAHANYLGKVKIISGSYLSQYAQFLSLFENGYFNIETDEMLEAVNGFINSVPRCYVCLAFVPTANFQNDSAFAIGHTSWSYELEKYSVFDISNLPNSDIPYYNTYWEPALGVDPDQEKISSIPFRVYESIYNFFFRNTVTQPFMINGEVKYNRYNTNLDDGADTTDYHLFKRNWELDAYTSCLPSPQQGNAPLVGLNSLGEVQITDENGISTAKIAIDESSGDTNVVVTNPAASIEHQRTLISLVQSGISINDFRATNALQRLLEQTLRSGYKYVDFIKGHFGSAPKHAVMDMPEFIGGFSKRIDVNMISNTNGVVPSESDSVLGSFAGQARVFGENPNKFQFYADDYGVIMGIVCFVPDAAYSQIVPKHFLYNNPLDFYFPEFSELGMQPITYGELCPVQSHLQYRSGDTSKKLTDTFGYQRPNHEYVWKPDTLHGQFRTTLKDYVINRIFEHRPELGNDFLTINPEETNSIFAVTEADNDVIVGQIVVKLSAKRPIPRIVIPGLGR